MLALILRSFVRIYAVPTNSMAPTLLPGDRIVVTRLITDTPARGDVIVFRDPFGRGIAVKRVIALPGELVDNQDTRVLVPAGHLFVMGDNRADSHDSRHWGPLPDHLVLGRARLILWQSTDGSRPQRRIFKWIE